jgi:hypothetical protein
MKKYSKLEKSINKNNEKNINWKIENLIYIH